MLPSLKTILSVIKGRRIHWPEVRRSYIYLGSDYGGWPVIPDHMTAGSTIWSFGLGTDISFDLGVIQRFGCKVVGFDPTPRSIDWLARQSLPDQFTYHQVGISSLDGEAEFTPPENDAHVSFSAQSSANTNRPAIKAPVRRLETLLKEFNVDVPEVLKMDIEGFEYAVIDDLLLTTIRPKQLLIEFHHTMYGIDRHQTRNAVRKLQQAGYKIFYVSDVGLEYGFCFGDQ